MKTTLYAFLILAAILISGILFDASVTEICADYQTALAEVSPESADNTLRMLSKIEQDWNKRKPFLAAFTHHSLLEEIQNALTRAKAAAKQNDPSLLAVEFEALQNALAALADADRPDLANIF